MRLLRAVVLVLVGLLVLVGVLFLGACGGEEKNAVDTRAASVSAPARDPIVIRATLMVAAEEGSEPIATGTVLDGSTLGGTPFCVGGTILESHASLDPEMKAYLIDRKITCPDGTVRIGFTPEVGAGRAPQGQTPQKGVWTIVSGTGEFEGLSGSGKGEAVYGPSPGSPVRSTFTGTVTRSRHGDGADSRRTPVPLRKPKLHLEIVLAAALLLVSCGPTEREKVERAAKKRWQARSATCTHRSGKLYGCVLLRAHIPVKLQFTDD